MSYNGYRNYETWLFMLYFEHDIYEHLKEQEEITYSAVYEMVESIINEMYNGIDKVEYGYAFIKDLITDSLDAIDIQEIAETIAQELETNRS